MFPLNNGDELCFNGSSDHSSSSHQQFKIPQDLILPDASMEGKDITVTHYVGKGGGRRKVAAAIDTSTSNNEKKLMHRDIERQRRQEMASLYAALRALLPLEFIKGKRSISDQMNVAVNYIKHLENRIQEIGLKRDELKKLSNLSSTLIGSQSGSSDLNISSSIIVVRSCLVGVEIAFNCGYFGQHLPLSKVLKLLLDEGLCVVNCVSTRVNESMIHTIQAEINDPSSLNLSGLQQKLNQFITSYL